MSRQHLLFPIQTAQSESWVTSIAGLITKALNAIDQYQALDTKMPTGAYASIYSVAT